MEVSLQKSGWSGTSRRRAFLDFHHWQHSCFLLRVSAGYRRAPFCLKRSWLEHCHMKRITTSVNLALPNSNGPANLCGWDGGSWSGRRHFGSDIASYLIPDSLLHTGSRRWQRLTRCALPKEVCRKPISGAEAIPGNPKRLMQYSNIV